MLTALSIVKLVAEIALMALLGRWVLGLLAGPARERNPFWQVLDIMARPFLRAARLVAPPIVMDRHVPLVAFLLLAFGWIVVTLMKIQHCLSIGMDQCR